MLNCPEFGHKSQSANGGKVLKNTTHTKAVFIKSARTQFLRALLSFIAATNCVKNMNENNLITLKWPDILLMTDYFLHNRRLYFFENCDFSPFRRNIDFWRNSKYRLGIEESTNVCSKCAKRSVYLQYRLVVWTYRFNQNKPSGA